MIILICKHCGKETAYVICENCGVNVVWYNKYGVKHDTENPGEQELFKHLDDSTHSKMTIENFLDQTFSTYTEDGSGD